MSTPHVSVCIPTRKRVKALFKCVESLISHANEPATVEICIRIHRDDVETLNELPNLLKWRQVKVVIGPERICHGCLWEDTYAIATGEWTWQFQDDAYVMTFGWDTLINSVEKRYILPQHHWLQASKYENDFACPFIAVPRKTLKEVGLEHFEFAIDLQFFAAYQAAGYTPMFIPVIVHHERMVGLDGVREADAGLCPN